ncbi:hypothetical protein [Paraburkholderia bonniea]|uniref:hypothetical protein n=1 Tax=Paraburkholderia bonniea TaxID=2152891 RepID=UPI001291A218|nr:hypothetical protein [Paraburkholderia bonniea]
MIKQVPVENPRSIKYSYICFNPDSFHGNKNFNIVDAVVRPAAEEKIPSASSDNPKKQNKKIPSIDFFTNIKKYYGINIIDHDGKPLSPDQYTPEKIFENTKLVEITNSSNNETSLDELRQQLGKEWQFILHCTNPGYKQEVEKNSNGEFEAGSTFFANRLYNPNLTNQYFEKFKPQEIALLHSVWELNHILHMESVQLNLADSISLEFISEQAETFGFTYINSLTKYKEIISYLIEESADFRREQKIMPPSINKKNLSHGGKGIFHVKLAEFTYPQFNQETRNLIKILADHFTNAAENNKISIDQLMHETIALINAKIYIYQAKSDPKKMHIKTGYLKNKIREIYKSLKESNTPLPSTVVKAIYAATVSISALAKTEPILGLTTFTDREELQKLFAVLLANPSSTTSSSSPSAFSSVRHSQ